MKKSQRLPFLIKVQDYHEFFYVQDTFNLINSKIKVIELTSVKGLTKQAKSMLDNLDPYIGLVYEGKRPTNRKILELLCMHSVVKSAFR